MYQRLYKERDYFMKKFLSVLLSVMILTSAFGIVPAFADVSFSDLTADHWAAEAVSKLVSDGTVNGFEDGTFRPTGTVSRAEFVKMLGKSSVKHENDFADVSKDHWAYDYIMYSGLDAAEGNNFEPARNITRGEVASLLYKRFANGEKEIAPYFITSQLEDANVAAWVYNTGLMLGADYVNLRFEDGLTRAEAAVLIVRAKELNPQNKRNFIDNFDDTVYKTVYEGMAIFDSEYNANENITYEELSTAAIRYQYKEYNPAISYVTNPKYDGKQARYWSIMCENALSEKGYGSTKEEALKNVTIEDAIAMFGFAAYGNYHFDTSVFELSTDTYREITVKDISSPFAKSVGFAYDMGISLYSDGKINAKNLVTKREIACMLLQYNMIFGSEAAYYCSADASYYTPLTLRTDKSTYPANYTEYLRIADEIPNYVYESPIGQGKDIDSAPAEYSRYLERYAYMHAQAFIRLSSDIKAKGADVAFTMYSTLAARIRGNGPVYRVKIEVGYLESPLMLSDIIPLADGVADRALTEGDIFFADIAANHQIVTTYVDNDRFTVDKIIG